MVFSSVPLYLDPPNWHHQQQNQLQTNGSGDDPHHQQLLPPLPPPAQAAQGPVRPGPMADRAQIAKMQPPDQVVLKCPRCESTNTKFCYFNNYSLSQPRHFCKTCRRYWTRGGALRNVPVGGGCRRNHKKSSKRSRSKSPAAPLPTITEKHALQQVQPSVATCHELIGRFPQLPSNRSFANSLQNMSRYGAVGGNIGHVEHVMGFQEQWRLQPQQFPNLLSGFDSTLSSSSSYPFHSEGVEAGGGGGGLLGVGDIIGAGNSSSRVKLEGNGGINLLRSPLTISENSNQQYYSWTDLSGLASSSSAAHLL